MVYFSVIFDLSSSFSAVGESLRHYSSCWIFTCRNCSACIVTVTVTDNVVFCFVFGCFLNVDFLPCVILFISSVLAYSFLRISLVRLSMSFSWITVQSVVHMWYCRVGKAKLLVASTFLGMEILLDQITDKRLRYSLVASLQTCCSRWTEFSYLPRNLQWLSVSSILSSSVSVIETFSSFIYNLPRTMLIVAHFSNPQKSSMSSNILSAVLVISSAFCAALW